MPYIPAIVKTILAKRMLSPPHLSDVRGEAGDSSGVLRGNRPARVKRKNDYVRFASIARCAVG